MKQLFFTLFMYSVLSMLCLPITLHSMGLTVRSKQYHDKVKTLLENGENVDQEDEAGRTPLVVSAQHVCPKSTTQLLAAGANCNIISRMNNGNALHVLFEQLQKKNDAYTSVELEDQALEIIELLRGSGTRLDHISDNGTVFHMAASIGIKSYLGALMIPVANDAIKKTTLKKVQSLLCALAQREQNNTDLLPPLPQELIFQILYFGLSPLECKYSGLDNIVVSKKERASFRRHLIHEALPQLKKLVSRTESLQLARALALEWYVMDVPCKAMDVAIGSDMRQLLDPEHWKVQNAISNLPLSQEMQDIEESPLD